MLHGRTLILDKNCGVYSDLEYIADFYFYDFAEQEILPNSIYVIGRPQVIYNLDKVNSILDRQDILVIFCNPEEGSQTLQWHLPKLSLERQVLTNKMPMIICGNMESIYPYVSYEYFLRAVVENNNQAIKSTELIFSKKHKPYKFLFLNGRLRRNRKYLIERLDAENILNTGLWTCLDEAPFWDERVHVDVAGVNKMLTTRPIKYLPFKYELPEVAHLTRLPPPDDTFVKYQLFDGIWRDHLLHPPQYIDTYFSIVTETVFEYPYSLRSEKIYKPIMMGHPWICSSNIGFYRDLKNLGFKTFSHLINEDFDTIDNFQDRLDRIGDVIVDLCNQDLDSFLDAAKDTCVYNQSHLIELSSQIRPKFREEFISFTKKYIL